MIAAKGVGSVLQQGEPQSTPGDIGLVSSMSAFGHCKHAPEQMASVREKCGIPHDERRGNDGARMMKGSQ
jgi:hypothetical protein